MPQATEHKLHAQSNTPDGAGRPTTVIENQCKAAKLLTMPKAAPAGGARATNTKRNKIIYPSC